MPAACLSFLARPPQPNPRLFHFHQDSSLRRSKQVVLIAQILSAICLPETCDTRRVQPPSFSGTSRRDAKTQRRIVHVVHHHALVLGTVVGPSANVGFDNVTAVQEGHLAVGSDPDLPSGVLGEDFESGDVKAEFTGLGEFSYMCMLV